MKNYDVLVIGGSAAGVVAAITGKNSWPNKSFVLIRKEKEVLVPCGIPYIFGTLDDSQLDVIPEDKMLENMGIESIVNEVISVDTKVKIAYLLGGEKIHYTKLVLATGSAPLIPKWLKGENLKNVFVIPKDRQYIDLMKDKLKGLKKVAVVGGGFIGVEFSDELRKTGLEVFLVEKEKEILSMAFDDEITSKITEILEKKGIKIITGKGIEQIKGANKVEGIELEDGEVIEVDAVILSMGYQPNTELAKKSGVFVDESNFIAVDEYMRTHIEDVFAVGDCAQKRDFITRKRVHTMLASTACAEARVAGMNLFNINVVKTFTGTIGIYSTMVGDSGFGTAGLTEKRAAMEGIDVVAGIFEGVDHHPGTLPGTHKQMVKLIVAKYSKIIVGGEVAGGASTGELTNVIGIAIENRMSIDSLLTSQIGTHPRLTGSPAAYPLIKAAENVVHKLNNI